MSDFFPYFRVPYYKFVKQNQISAKFQVMFTLEQDGKVRCCFSNKISTVTHKVVMFSMEITEGAAPNTDDSHRTVLNIF